MNPRTILAMVKGNCSEYPILGSISFDSVLSPLLIALQKIRKGVKRELFSKASVRKLGRTKPSD